MKTDLVLKILTIAQFLPAVANAQGTFLYDQQSSDESNSGNSGNFIQSAQPTGQSFTPSLNGIGFVRLNIFDWNANNGTGAVIYVNLRSDSITGTIIDSTTPVSLPDNFGLPLGSGSQFVNLYFANTVPLQPGVTYFLQPVVQSGDVTVILGDVFNYSGGAEYAFGNASTADYWFREGIVVPEPSSSILLLLGATSLVRSRLR